MMKIRILDRILVAIAGLILLALCAGIVAQVFCGADVISHVTRYTSSESTTARIIIGAGAGCLLLIGLYCFLVLFRHRRRHDKFLIQKMESGDLAISLKAMETMVTKCLDQHPEITTQSVRLENLRDGLIVRIRGTVSAGISIPLTVDTLQKQIKQYVTACSGVEVKEIRVQVESTGEEAKDAVFAIDPPAATPLLHGGEKKKEEAEEAETIPARDEAEPVSVPEAAPARSAAEAAMAAAENLKKELGIENEDDRPLHQRIFSTPEEPCIMPLPPENLNGSEEAADAAETEAAEPEAEATEQAAAEPEAAPEADGTEPKTEENPDGETVIEE